MCGNKTSLPEVGKEADINLLLAPSRNLRNPNLGVAPILVAGFPTVGQAFRLSWTGGTPVPPHPNAATYFGANTTVGSAKQAPRSYRSFGEYKMVLSAKRILLLGIFAVLLAIASV